MSSPSSRSAALVVALTAIALPALTQAACERPAARLVAFQGKVEEQREGSDKWQDAPPEHGFCSGDKLRTLQYSRATLELENKTYVSLEQRTTLVFSGLKAKEPSWLDLLKGVLYLRSRTPSSLDIRTPFVNAAIKGTEFLVGSSDTEGQVTVFEGRIEVSNTKGSLVLTDGQTAVAQTAAAPVRKLSIQLEDAVQWALYYPPLLDLESLKRSPDPAIKAAAGLYLAGDAEGALSRLEGSSQGVILAGLLLGIGRVDEAKALLDQPAPQAPSRERADVQALRAVIALARNQSETALAQAEQSTHTDPASPLGWIALSYVRQAAFKLEAALESAQKAAHLAPENGLIQARIAELSAALGQRSEARQAAERAVQLNPNLARAWAVKGFAQLNNMDVKEARSSFHQALRLDANDPLSRFGLGLAEIRQGELERGTADLEIAASLDPSDALTRSYLGKAYYEQKRSKLADTEYQLAKQFDPRDPTPWFYDAIKKHTENRPVEALQDMQKAIELNGNRAIYRSKQMLDSDLAARGAAIGRIYNELGFGPRALVEAWSALADDPGDYSSHRLLSDAYSALPRHDLARSSELLQSQLLQPINITPVQPRLAESNLFLVGNLGPSALSLNEFNPLFDRNRFSTLVSGLVGSNDTYSDEVVHSGLWNDWSYSLGQFHYQTRGFRRNNDIDANVYNAFVQGRVLSNLSVQAEYRHRDIEYGDLRSTFFPLPEFVRGLFDHQRRNTSSDTYRLGFNLTSTEHSKLLGSFIHLEQSAPFTLEPFEFSGSAGPRSVPGDKTIFFARANYGEIQYQYEHTFFKSIAGGGFGQIDLNDNRIHSRQQQGNGYLYTDIGFPASVKWTFGASVDVLDDSGDSDNPNSPTRRAFNPKAGVLWHIAPNTIFRAAAFKTSKRYLLAGQTLEPTQIAGFNQLFDDRNATRATRYGVGLDQRFHSTFSGGIELSERQLEVPNASNYLHWRETLYRGYLLWTPHPRWSATLEYYLEDFQNRDLSTKGGPSNTETQYIPLGLAYFDPSGWFARFKATHYRQQNTESDYRTGHDTAAFLDLGLGYRLPKRLGIFELQFQNLLDQHYRYEGLMNRTASENLSGGVPPYLPFPPEFTVSARLTLAF